MRRFGTKKLRNGIYSLEDLDGARKERESGGAPPRRGPSDAIQSPWTWSRLAVSFQFASGGATERKN